MGKGKLIKQPKVSVIIPVYNTEDYVEEAVRSIMNQTLKDIEIIIIDDGSTDKSPHIIKNLTDEDNRILYLSQANKGQSVARNRGILRSSGTYIYFMDSDDILNEQALELSYKKCLSENLDFVTFDATTIGESKVFSIEYNKINRIDEKTYKGIDLLNLLLDKKLYRVPPWLYFINASFLKNKTILFEESLRIYEDQLFSFQLFLSANRVSFLAQVFFYRRIHPASLMNSLFSKRKMDAYFDVALLLAKLGKSKNREINRVLHKTIKEMLNAATYMAHSLPIKERLDVCRKILENYRTCISVKSWIVLLFPISIKIKSFFK